MRLIKYFNNRLRQILSGNKKAIKIKIKHTEKIEGMLMDKLSVPFIIKKQ